MTVEHVGVLLEVLADRDVELIAVHSAQRTKSRSQVAQPAPPLHTESPSGSAHSKYHRASRCGLGLHLPTHRLRLVEVLAPAVARTRRASPRVQARPAPVVVRVPRGGREHQDGPSSRSARRGAHDEERVGALVAGGEGHGVVAAAPVRADRYLERSRPPASVRGGIVGDRVRLASDPEGVPDDLPFGALPRHLHVVRCRAGRDVQRERLAGCGRPREAVPSSTGLPVEREVAGDEDDHARDERRDHPCEAEPASVGTERADLRRRLEPGGWICIFLRATTPVYGAFSRPRPGRGAIDRAHPSTRAPRLPGT